MQEIINKLTSKQAMDVIHQVEEPFKGVPHLPKGFVIFIAQIAPWIAGIGGIMAVLSGISALTATAGWQSMPGWMTYYTGISPIYFLLIAILQLVSGALLLMAFKPLQNRQMTGWVLLFWNMVVGLLQSLVGIVFTVAMASSLIGTVIGLAIGLYILFELKPEYKN